MSYGIMPFVVNIEKVVKAIKSDDPVIKQELKMRCEHEILDTIEFDNDSESFIREAMEELINNKMLDDPDKAAKYWYHLKEIIANDEFEMQNNDEWYPCDSQIFYDIADLYFFGELEIPAPDDFPVVFTLENKNLQTLSGEIDKYYAGVTYLQKAINQFKEWIDLALRNGCDLVMYYH